MTILGGGEEIMGIDNAADKLAAAQPRAGEAPASTPPEPDSDPSELTSPRDKDITGGLANLKRQEMTVADANTRRMEQRVEQDRARLNKAFEKEQYAAGNMPQPWNADQERANRIRGPFENFGSAGMIFAMFASLATRTPMTSALNAGAAAMNSIRESDEKGYDKAYQAWKDNTTLALKQFDVERQVFQDSEKLLTTDVTLWRAHNIANEARFGNKKALFMLENGMDKEYLEAKTAQIKAADGMRKSMQDGQIFDTQRQMFSTEVREFQRNHPDAEPRELLAFKLNTLRDITSGKRSIEQDMLDRDINNKWREDGHEPDSKWKSDRYKEILAGRYGSRDTLTLGNRIRLRAAEYMKPTEEGGLGLTPIAAMDRAEREEKAATASQSQVVTTDRQIAAAALKRREELKTEHPDWSNEQLDKEQASYTAKLRTESAGLTGRLKDELKGKIGQVKLAEKVIDNIDRMLLKHNAITGLGGSFTRPLEVVGNILGSTATDRKQFERWVLEMQEIAPRILLDTKGRPLSAEAGRINGIIAGLRPGDTGPNTLRAYKEFRDTLNDIKDMLQERLGESASGQRTTTPPAGKWWDDPSAGATVQ